MHVRRLDGFRSEVHHDFTDHDTVPQLPPVFVNQHHLVGFVVVYAVVVILAYFVLDQKIELRVHDLNTYVLLVYLIIILIVLFFIV